MTNNCRAGIRVRPNESIGAIPLVRSCRTLDAEQVTITDEEI